MLPAFLPEIHSQRGKEGVCQGRNCFSIFPREIQGHKAWTDSLVLLDSRYQCLGSCRAPKGFPSASPFPTQTEAQRIYCPLTTQARGFSSEEGVLMPHSLVLIPRRYLHAPTPKIRPFQSDTQGCLGEEPLLLSHHITSTPIWSGALPGHVPWAAECAAKERMLKIPREGLSVKHVVVRG